MKIYQEKNFMHNRDINAYRFNQASSCLYLDKRLNQYMNKIKNDKIFIVWSQLRDIHRRQFRDLGCPTANSEPSFYFDTMFDNVDLGDERMARLLIHHVSYLRGQQRYDMLSRFLINKFPHYHFIWEIWEQLYDDATWNASLCLNFLKDEGTDFENDLKKVIEIEATLMKQIDKRNSTK